MPTTTGKADDDDDDYPIYIQSQVQLARADDDNDYPIYIQSQVQLARQIMKIILYTFKVMYKWQDR